MKTKKCCKCKKDKPIDKFAFKNKKTGQRSSICKVCHNEYMKSHYINNSAKYKAKARTWTIGQRVVVRDYLYNYLKAHSCVDCGEANPVVLEFDHVKGIKKSNISDMISQGRSLKTVQEEIDKCETRCANCHRMKTAKDYNWRIYNLYINDIK